jgi:uncharacterized membrane protein
MHRTLLKLCYLIIFLPAPALATDAWQIEIATSHKADVVDVRGQAVIAAPPEVIWATLTDYERLPDFVPGLKVSKVIDRKVLK